MPAPTLKHLPPKTENARQSRRSVEGTPVRIGKFVCGNRICKNLHIASCPPGSASRQAEFFLDIWKQNQTFSGIWRFRQWADRIL